MPRRGLQELRSISAAVCYPSNFYRYATVVYYRNAVNASVMDRKTRTVRISWRALYLERQGLRLSHLELAPRSTTWHVLRPRSQGAMPIDRLSLDKCQIRLINRSHLDAIPRSYGDFRYRYPLFFMRMGMGLVFLSFFLLLLGHKMAAGHVIYKDDNQVCFGMGLPESDLV